MYQHGRPARPKFNRLIGLAILAVIVVFGLASYWFITQKDKKLQVKSDSTPLITNIEGDGSSSLTVDEPLYSMVLPGSWKFNSKVSTSDRLLMQWDHESQNRAGRWIRIYIDKTPQDFAVNYLLPVSASGSSLEVGQVSENCVTFTEGATNRPERDVSTPMGSAVLPARWQKTNFLCDNSRVSHQVVGTGSSEGINTVLVTGSKQGKHRYFFVYRDDNFHPDYSIFINILSSFHAK